MSQADLLRSRRFLPLFLTQFLGAFNDNVFKNALVIFIAFTLADAAGMSASLLVILAGGIFILPFFLFSALAGQIADKFEKSRLIRLLKLAEVLIMLLGAAGFVIGSVYLLMFTLFLMGSQSAFFGPIKYGILPQHLSVAELTGGNGMVQMATYLAILAGTMFGGLVVAIPGAGPQIAGVTVVLIALVGRLASEYIPEAAPGEPQLQLDANLLRQTWRVIGFAAESRVILQSILAISWFWFLGATFLSLVPDFTRTVLSGNEQVATLLLTAFSVGIGVGSLLCERLSRGGVEPGLAPIGALGMALCAADLSFIDLSASAGPIAAAEFVRHAVYWHVLLDLTLIGFFGGIYVVPLYALVQHRCNAARRSRIIAANNILNALFMVASAAIVIALVQTGLGPQRIFLLAAVATALVLLSLCVLLPEVLQRSVVLVKSWVGAAR
ncbi:MAG: MFS transporter [Gammaproteobacteria bacterium]|nr:MFS transporter [Gammaproteobacteria bacterium]